MLTGNNRPPRLVYTNETRPIRGAGSLDSLTRAALQENWGSATKSAGVFGVFEHHLAVSKYRKNDNG